MRNTGRMGRRIGLDTQKSKGVLHFSRKCLPFFVIVVMSIPFLYTDYKNYKNYKHFPEKRAKVQKGAFL